VFGGIIAALARRVPSLYPTQHFPFP
jgi:hypothetical protein